MPTIVETRICKQTGQEFDVLQEELDLLEQISPVLNGKKYLIPISKYHPDIGHQWRLAWRNERTLYRTTCDLTGVSIISCYNPKLGYTIYNHHDRWGDTWEPMEYGMVYNESRSFSDQFTSYFLATPRSSLNVGPTLKNCDYCNYGMGANDCYMCTSAIWSEQCYYSSLPFKSYYDVDGFFNTSVQYCYQCIYAMNCYECQYVIYCHDCKYSSFLLDCRDCDHCFSCVNLNHKKYCIFNEQYDQQAYKQKVQELYEQYSLEELSQQFHIFAKAQPKRATRNKQVENTTGDMNIGVSNSYYCFDIQDAKDFTYCRLSGVQATDYVRCTLVGIGSRMYSCIGCGESDSCAFCVGMNSSHQCFYCYQCRDCEHCFGCVRLLHKKYCIFNKQYTKEEYEKELTKIIEAMKQTGERGESFNPALSPFPYNDSNAYEWFPETKEEILKKGWNWIDKEEKTFEGETYIPLSIAAYKGDTVRQQELLAGTLVCTMTGKPFRIIQQELDFYLKFSIEIPRKHPDTRYQERIEQWRLPRKLFERTCAKTGVKIFTPYGLEREEEVWSEEVWDKEFLG